MRNVFFFPLTDAFLFEVKLEVIYYISSSEHETPKFMWTADTFSLSHSFRFGHKGNASSWSSDHRLAAYLKGQSVTQEYTLNSKFSCDVAVIHIFKLVCGKMMAKRADNPSGLSFGTG